MCGRYTLAVPGELVAEVFGAELDLEHDPRWNIAPTETAPVVRVDGEGRRRLEAFDWGFRAFWDRNAATARPLINARSETVQDKPAFRSAFAARRCLVPADGFYEWRDELLGRKTVRSPLHFRRRDRGLLAMAGIWSPAGSAPRPAFAILTTRPNELVAPIHDRMPAILPSEAWAAWLDPSTDPELLASLLEPYPAELMEAAPANRALNRAGREGPDLLTEEGPGPLFAE